MAKARKVGKFHAHGCAECRQRYTDTCSKPFANGRCLVCRTGQKRAIWDVDRLPQPCCYQHSKHITEAELLNRYGLGGSTPWFRCTACGRTHPYLPREESV